MTKARPGKPGGAARRATPAVAQLVDLGISFQLHEFDHDPSVRHFGLEAASATGVDPALVFKTLIASVDQGLAVAIVPSDRQLSMKALAAALGSKRAELADLTAAERTTGYVRGGISPFGQKRHLPAIIDQSALSHPTIYVSGGRRGLEIELEPGVLVSVLNAIVATIT